VAHAFTMLLLVLIAPKAVTGVTLVFYNNKIETVASLLKL